MSEGSRQIQNGGSLPGPSCVSSLKISVMDESVAGTYACLGPFSVQKSIRLDIQTGTSTFTTLALVILSLINLCQ